VKLIGEEAVLEAAGETFSEVEVGAATRTVRRSHGEQARLHLQGHLAALKCTVSLIPDIP
jgi:hypothetical protein